MIATKKYITPFFLLTFPVIIDALNGYQLLMQGSAWIASVYKVIILLYTARYAYISDLGPVIKKILLIFTICMTYQFCSCGVISLSNIIKYIYPYFVAGYFICCYSKYGIYSILRCLVLYGVIAAIIIIICGLFGFGYNPYGAIIGTRGLFKGGNEICLTLVLTNCLTVYMYQTYTHTIDLIFFLLISSACLIMATTTGITGTLVIYIGIIITFFILKIPDYQPSKLQKLLIILLAVFAIYYVADSFVAAISDIDYLSAKFENINDRFTKSSGRSYLIDAAKKTLSEFSLFDWLFGAYHEYHSNIGKIVFDNTTIASAEVDWLDLVGDLGVLGTLVLVYKPVYYIIVSVKKFFSKKTLETFWLLWINLLFIFIAVYAGHAFAAMNAVLLLLLVNYFLLNKSYQ